jgi:tetratricopeptide (TPR) repeat protein
VDENGLVVSVDSVPERKTPFSSKKSTGGKTGAKKRYRPTPEFKWAPSTGPKLAKGIDRSALDRWRVEERRRQAKEKAVRIRTAEEALKRTEDKIPTVEQLTDFDEAYALGVAASTASSPNYPLAIAAFKKAYRINPRRKVRPGRKPDPGLFEVPMKLAAAYRLNGQFYEAQKMYEWILNHHDSRIARMELAAVYEDSGKHSKALKLYKEWVLTRDPHDARALHGVARTLRKLGRGEEAHEAYKN